MFSRLRVPLPRNHVKTKAPVGETDPTSMMLYEGKGLLEGFIEFFDDFVGEIQAISMIDDNFEDGLAPLINDHIKSMSLCDDAGSLLNFLHIFLDEFSLFFSKFCLKFLSAFLPFLKPLRKAFLFSFLLFGTQFIFASVVS